MKQVLQNLKDGKTELAEVPCPGPRAGHLFIRTHASLVSAGTERMLLEFGKAGWIDKARQQPDKVKQVLEKVRTDGLAPTLEAVRSKLDQPIALGYCNVGEVIGSGRENPGGLFEPGARVVSNGAHAEMVCVPGNLCARVPDGVSDEEAAFTVVGAIALQGVRLARPTLGECFVVTGLGLIGLMAVQLLKAHGCRVLGIDLDPRKLELARSFGAETVDLSGGEDPVLSSKGFSRGRGVDGVLITASTKSSEPVHQAALMCRKRGRIVLVGVTGLELSRDDFYKKELSFQVSCSYGPGRYDPQYEEKGCDYPVGYVRWTEQRNFEAVLDMMAEGRLGVRPLITHRFPIEEAVRAYELLGGKEPYLGIILEYHPQMTQIGADETYRTGRVVALEAEKQKEIDRDSRAVVGFIGAGNYAGRVLIPAFKAAGAALHSVASSGGVSAVHFGKKFGFQQATTEAETILSHEEIDTVVIATRHNTHARFVCEALRAGKHVFVEKPLCLTLDELAEIQDTVASLPASPAPPKVMVGFNRRFAPQVRKMKELLSGVQGPKSFIMTVNAGQIPGDHWTQDPAVGGGRIIGEACHFIDLLRFLAGSAITRYDAAYVGEDRLRDKATLTLGFADGSLGTVHYFADGHKSFPKERLEVFCGGRVLQLDNFRKLRGFGWKGFRKMNLWRQDKGQAACAAAFVEAVKEGKPGPIPLEELVEVSRVTIHLASADDADYFI
ncbi:bi-domain-containing oxidoreductase [Desulforhabdus amnigena]|uniref:Oxidoreductase n=1 Tax=Desulforhabdus amnigena TaxID=40218 RepID=A0A9W6FWV5_9BACT|nr:bi-domain-containing oxidoreductase [Desulforhabdus amnigena]GLI36439.1 oxidoreductase [Desulforhabdus amnigena]